MSLQPPLPMSAPKASNNQSVNSDTSQELDEEASLVYKVENTKTEEESKRNINE